MISRVPTIPIRALAAACLAAGLGSCVTQTIPSHGGGKRFFYEQAVVTASVDHALAQLDVSPLEDKGIKQANVYVIAMGDEGGGIESGGGLLGVFGANGNGFAGSSGEGAAAIGDSGRSGSHAFANARDIEYLSGRVTQFLESKGIRVAEVEDSEVEHEIYFLVSQFGTFKSSFNLLVYQEVELAGRTSLEAFALTGTKSSENSSEVRYIPLGAGECSATYKASYFFGYGPLRGAEISIEPGSLPVRYRVLPDRARSQGVVH